MRKFFIVLIIVLFIGLLLLSWHSYEEKARGEWKTRTLIIKEKAYNKMIENSWTKEQEKLYIDSLAEATGISYPMICPYCYYKYLMHKHNIDNGEER